MRPSWTWICAAALGTLFLLGTAGSVRAQTRSDTGRHQPPPPVEEEVTKDSETSSRSSGSKKSLWHVGLVGGLQGGGDLFRVEVVNGPPVPWDSITTFQSSRFTATLDTDFALGLYLARDLGSVWTVRADIGYSRIDVAAEALVGQTGAVFLYDRVDVVNIGLGVEARLTRHASYPFFQGAVLISSLEPGRSKGLEQTTWGGRLGLGYHQSLGRLWGLRVEGRLSRTGFSTGDFVPQAKTFEQPEIDLDPADHLMFFELLIGIQISI